MLNVVDRSKGRPTTFVACAASFLLFARSPALAEDWGAYSIVPVSAPTLVLEAVDAGKTEGTMVSIGKPSGAANQKWTIHPKDDQYFVIKPLHSPELVLTAAKDGIENGTRIILETDRGKPGQQWLMKRHDDGTYSLLPRHTSSKGLDHLGGRQVVGAQIDLWDYNGSDPHLQWMIKPLAGSPVAAVNSTTEATSNYVPPELKPEEILPGQIKNCSFSTSTIFPGTVRDVSVFIPAQYDGSTPACVYVKFDGYNPKEKGLLERLIAGKEMPVTIGVFVRPGELPSTVKNTMGRRNRCFEYDGVGENNVRFLVDELLPFVAKQFDLKLSSAGNDRCIAGGSSGGIAAFNTAWERPDAFTRVYANSGSFVAFRGGHEFPTLVRKFEAKPIRAYLTTGVRDMENCAGDWYLIDQEMDKALRFSGYDFRFRTINGGHVAGYYENFQEAMSFLWKGWPEPVRAGPSAPRAREILIPQENWQLVSEDFPGAKAPACNASGELFFVDTAKNRICRLSVDGKISDFVNDAGEANGLTFGADGRLFAVSNDSGKIIGYDSSGKGSLVIDGLRGNHLLATPDGGLYVTSNEDSTNSSGKVWSVKDGKKTQVDAGLNFASGLAYRPDQWLLSVADGHSKWVYSYQINGDGTLSNKERFFWLHVPDWEDNAGAESVCYAREGQMFVATKWGIQVCADDGPTQVILPMPDRSRVFAVCFAGANFDTLFAFCGEKIWKRKVKLHGVGAFTPWSAVNPSKL